MNVRDAMMLQWPVPPRVRWDWLAVGAAGAVLAAAAAYEPTNLLSRPLVLAAVALAAPLGLIVLLRWPGAALVAFAAAALAVPLKIGTGTESGINTALLLSPVLIGAWGLRLLIADRPLLRLDATTGAALAFALAAVLGFIAGQAPWYAVQGASLKSQLGGLGIFLFSAGMFLVASHLPRPERTLPWVVAVVLVLGAVDALLDAAPAAVDERFAGIFEDLGEQAVWWVWIVVLGVSQAFYNTDLRRRWRIAAGAVALATLAFALTLRISWTSGWLPPLIGVWVIVVIGTPRLGVVVTAAMGVVAFVLGVAMFAKWMDSESGSVWTRLAIWQAQFPLLTKNPLLGLGPSNYYFYGTRHVLYYQRISSHNNFFDLLAQTGIVGLACFLWLVTAAGLAIRGVIARGATGFRRAYALGAMGGLVAMVAAMMFGDWVVPFVYNIGFDGCRASLVSWVLVGGAVALARPGAMSMRVTHGGGLPA